MYIYSVCVCVSPLDYVSYMMYSNMYVYTHSLYVWSQHAGQRGCKHWTRKSHQLTPGGKCFVPCGADAPCCAS